MNHTPGPWQVLDRTDILALEGTRDAVIVASTRFFSEEPTERQLADARLIAAAPELLVAAKQLHDDDYTVAEAAWVALRAAIAKAEGRA